MEEAAKAEVEKEEDIEAAEVAVEKVVIEEEEKEATEVVEKEEDKNLKVMIPNLELKVEDKAEEEEEAEVSDLRKEKSQTNKSMRIKSLNSQRLQLIGKENQKDSQERRMNLGIHMIERVVLEEVEMQLKVATEKETGAILKKKLKA